MDTSTFLKVKDGVATREPIPEELRGLPPEALLDLDWLPESYGVFRCIWVPADDQSPLLGPYDHYGSETLTFDPVRMVVVVVKVVVPGKNPARRITPLAFLSRFTSDEVIAVEMAALDDPAAAVAVRHSAALIRSYLRDVMTAKFVFLDDVRTLAGVQYLEAAGIITAARAEEILTAEVQPGEEI